MVMTAVCQAAKTGKMMNFNKIQSTEYKKCCKFDTYSIFVYIIYSSRETRSEW